MACMSLRGLIPDHTMNSPRDTESESDSEMASPTQPHVKSPEKTGAKPKKKTLEKKCSHCSKTFRSKTGLREHEQKHVVGSKYHACPAVNCSKKFATIKTLKRHIDMLHTHANIRISSCKCDIQNKFEPTFCYQILSNNKYVCSPVTSLQESAAVTSESAAQTFDCEICKKSYKSRNGLKAHQLKHENFQLECPSEGCFFTKFSDLKSIQRHCNRFHPEKTVRACKCNIANKLSPTHCYKIHVAGDFHCAPVPEKMNLYGLSKEDLDISYPTDENEEAFVINHVIPPYTRHPKYKHHYEYEAVQNEQNHSHSFAKKEKRENSHLLEEIIPLEESLRNVHLITRPSHSPKHNCSCTLLKSSNKVLSAKKDTTLRDRLMAPFAKKVVAKTPKKQEAALDPLAKFLFAHEDAECTVQTPTAYCSRFFNKPKFFMKSMDFEKKEKTWKTKFVCRHGLWGVCKECIEQRRAGKTVLHDRHDPAYCDECVKFGHFLIADLDA